MSEFNPTPNNISPMAGVTNDANLTPTALRVDPITKRLLVDTSLTAQDIPASGLTTATAVQIVDGSGNQITSFGGGTQYTEDAAAAANPVGNAFILIRDDALSGQTTTDGDNVAARGTDKGELYTKAVDSDAILTTIDTVLDTINAKLVTGTDIGDVTINNASGAAAVNIQDGGNSITVDGTVAVTNADITSIKTAVETIDNAISGNEMQVDVVAALPAGTNALGKLLPPDVDVTAHTNYARKYYTSAGAATDGIIWSPAAGKRWHVVTLYLNVSAAATVTLEDDKSGGDDPVWKGELAANSGVVLQFTEKYPMASGEDAADLTITTTAGNVYVTCVGYEV